ncbi:MAG: adenosyl-hopene transferase HpnH [Candidatus Ancaeobacter aquaticus]|nr:adenosyl-hopene transferase HpnH [Candidatus Ancaeobacter aquaticus]
MKFHPLLLYSLTSYIVQNKVRNNDRYPLVLMLEPLHKCNLSCEGCGKIREFKDTLSDMLSLKECFSAIDESGAPIISITGGEPLIYPEIDALVSGIISRKKHIYLCTNALLLSDFLSRNKPSPYLNINVSLDGMDTTHDAIRNRSGVFAQAIKSIKDAKKRGYRVVINTTIYSETNVGEIVSLLTLLKSLKVNGIMLAPGFSYFDSDSDMFLTKEKTINKFKELSAHLDKIPIMNTPLYMDFLQGKRSYDCTPWGNPNRNVRGWKSPCYLITDTHYDSFNELMNKTPWEKYGPNNDKRCKNCMMHCGYEPTIAREAGKNFKDTMRMIKWNLF